MKALTIREANIDDADAIADVHVRCWRETYPGIVPSSMIDDLSVTRRASAWREALGKHPSPEDLTVLVALCPDSGVIGFGACGKQRSDHPNLAIFDAEFQAIYLLASHQRRGLGRAIMSKMADRLLKAGYQGASLWVLHNNEPAKQVYEALGGTLVAAREERRPSGIILHEQAYAWRDLATLL